MPKGRKRKPKKAQPVQEQVSQEEIAKMEADHEAEEQKPQVTFDPELIERLRAVSRADQEKNDAALDEGVNLFFNNEYDKAEQVFKDGANRDPLYAGAYATVGFVRAAMSLGKEESEESRRRLTQTEALATAVLPNQGYIASAAKLFTFKRGTERMTNAVLRAHVIKGESSLLSAMLLVLQESVYSYVKAGFALRRTWKALSTAWKVVQDLEKEGVDPLTVYDRHTLSGVYFGIGAMNVINAALPPKFLGLLSVFGMPHDGKIGVEQLHHALGMGGLRGVMASLALMVIHGVVPAFAPILLPEHIERADQVTKWGLERFPTSCIHLWLAGRLARSKRDEALALENFQQSSTAQSTFIQLKHINWYDLAWCYAFQCEWGKAAQLFQQLGEENDWSKTFYTYAQGVCLQEAGMLKEATECYKKASSHSSRKFGGKTLSAEQFVFHRVEDHEDSGDLFIPGIELVNLFNGFPQSSHESLRKMKELVVAAQAKLGSDDHTDDESDFERHALCHLIIGNLLKELGEVKEASTHYAWVMDRERYITYDKYLVPYTAYEFSTLLAVEGDHTTAKKIFAKAKDAKDFSFELRLQFRVTLTQPKLEEMAAR